MDSETKIMKGTIINKLKKLREEFHQFYNPQCEFGQGYLDCLHEVAKELNIPSKRLEFDVVFKECGKDISALFEDEFRTKIWLILFFMITCK